jgi:hypothetical protein
MLNLSIECTRFQTNYSSCTVRSSENICSSSGGAQEKGKTVWNSVYYQNWWFSEFHPPPCMLMYFFAGCFFNLTGFWCCVFLTLQITNSNVLQLCDATRKIGTKSWWKTSILFPPPKVQIWICLSSFCGFGSLQLSRCHHTCHNTDLPSDQKLIGRILQHWRDTVAILMSILLPAGPEKAVTNPQVSRIACTRKLTWDFVSNFCMKKTLNWSQSFTSHSS